MNIRQLEPGNFPIDSWRQAAAGCICFLAGGHEIKINQEEVNRGLVTIIPSRFAPYLDCSSQGILIGIDQKTAKAILQALAWPPKRRFPPIDPGDHAITGWRQVQSGYIIIQTTAGLLEIFDVSITSKRLRLQPSQFAPKVSLSSFECTVWTSPEQIKAMQSALGL